jgi:hypothetical protein
VNPNSAANLIPFKPGQSGNPGGRPNGARTRLQGDFLNALAAHFAEHGKDAIERVYQKNPVAYIKAVASLMPKQFEQADPFEGMENEDIRTLLSIVRLARQRRDESVTGERSA